MLFRVVSVLVVTLIPLSTFAQGTTSRLDGVVTDGSGAAVANATVNLVNEGTNATFTTKSAENGSYAFEALQSGSYTVNVEAAGFKKFAAKGSRVTIGQPTTVNIKLEVGAVTESIEVSGAAELVQTSTSGNFGQLIEEKTIKDLPIVGLRGRNPLDLVLIQPGVNNGSNTGGGIHIHGARDRAWNFTLDGIDINETSAGGGNFTPIRPNPDMLAEFRVVTGNFTADTGRNSGAQVSMVTKSGTNELHGSGFWLYRTPRLSANEWENNINNVGKPQLVQHIFGGTLGGPIVKNRTFFFASGQGLKTLQTSLVTRTVYTESARQGIFRYNRAGRTLPAGLAGSTVDLQGNPVPGANIGSYNVFTSDPQRIGADPTVAAAIAQTPLPNRFDYAGTTAMPTDGLNTAGYSWNAPQYEKQNDIVFKIDQIIDDQNTIYFRYAFGQQDTQCDASNGGQALFPGLPCIVNTARNPRNLAINWRTNPSPTVTNELVIGYNSFGFIFDQPLASLSQYSLVSTPVSTLTDYSFGNNRKVRTAQLVDNFSWVKGGHTIKFGMNFRFQRQEDDRGSVGGQNANPALNFSTTINTVDPATFGLPADLNTTFDRPNFQSSVNFLLGRVGQRQQGFISNGANFVPGRFSFTTDYPEYDLYIQDTWKVNKNLTLEAGLRWEARFHPSNEEERIRVPNSLLVAGAAPTNTATWVPGKLYDDDLNNFGPSLGFAWDPFGTGKTSIRSNYRIAFDRIPTFLFASTYFPNMPGETTAVVDQSYGQSGGRLSGVPSIGTPTATPAALSQPVPYSPGTITTVDPNLRTPITHQWAFSIQREVFRNTIIEASYIGRRAYGLFGAYNANQVDIFGNGWLEGFKQIQAGGESPLINRVVAADSRIRAGETASGMIRRLFANDLNINDVAFTAQRFAQQIQGGRNVTDLSGAGGFFFTPFTQFNTVNVIDSNDFSTYHALELLLERRFSSNLFINFNYTWSKSLDTRSFDPAFTTASTGSSQSASSTPWDLNNRKLNYGISDFDRPHQVKFTASWDLPFGRGKKYANSASRMVDHIIGGWRLAPIVSWTSGRPFTVFSGSNTVSNVTTSPANCDGCSRSDGGTFDDPVTGLKYFFNAEERARFSSPAPGTLGNTARNYFRTQGQFNLNASLAKHINITEKYKLELRGDATNVTNTPTFGMPTTTFTSSTFGRIRDTVVSSSRRIQVGARFYF